MRDDVLVDHDAGPEHHVRLDHRVPTDLRVVAEEHRLRRDQRHARRHCRRAQAVLEVPLDGRELRPVVDALDLLLGRSHRDRAKPEALCDLHGVGQVVLPLAFLLSMRSSILRAISPRSAMRPALHRVIARSAGLASRCSRMALRWPSVSMKRP